MREYAAKSACFAAFLEAGRKLRAACLEHGLDAPEFRGMRPLFGLPFWRMLFTRRVSAEFGFTFTNSTRLGFSGLARKRG